MNAHKRAQYLQALAIPEWSLRKSIAPVATETAVQETYPVAEADEQVENMPLSVNEAEAGAYEPEVFQLQGVGNSNADCLLIGNIATVDEDELAFAETEIVLLKNMLKAIGLTVDDVFTLNPLVCLATRVRDPQESEIALCKDYLLQHINTIQPKAVLLMSQLTAEILLNTQQTIAQLSGKVHTLSAQPGLENSETQVVVTYSPAHLLKKPIDKRKAWEDLKKLKQLIM